jgi:hypothetical protein
MRALARLCLVLVVLAAPVVPASPARAADVPAAADVSWLRLAAYYGKRFGPSIVAFVSELAENLGGSGGDSPPPPPPPDGDPPMDDPDFAP